MDVFRNSLLDLWVRKIKSNSSLLTCPITKWQIPFRTNSVLPGRALNQSLYPLSKTEAIVLIIADFFLFLFIQVPHSQASYVVKVSTLLNTVWLAFYKTKSFANPISGTQNNNNSESQYCEYEERKLSPLPIAHLRMCVDKNWGIYIYIYIFFF